MRILFTIVVVAFVQCGLLFRFQSIAQTNKTLSVSEHNPTFEHITAADGLPEGQVGSILQDHLGFLWFGNTSRGLVKYDGYSMTTFLPDPDDTNSISDGPIIALFEDHSGILWVGTERGGLNRFNRANETFTHYLHNADDSSSINSSHVSSLYEDKAGRLWVGTDKGLNLLDRKTNRFERYHFQDRAYSPDAYDYLSTLEKSGRSIASLINPDVDHTVNKTSTFALTEKTEVFTVFTGKMGMDHGWLENENGKIVKRYDLVQSLFAGGAPDHRIQMFLDTLRAGTYVLHYASDHGQIFSTIGDVFSSELWGIRVFAITGEGEKIRRLLDNVKSVSIETRILAMTENKSTGGLFVGTGYPGLWTFDPEQKAFATSPDNMFTYKYGMILSFHQASDGTIWMGTARGLSHFDPQNKQFTFHQMMPSAIFRSGNAVRSVTQDQSGFVWGAIGENGLMRFDPETGQFRHYPPDSNDPNGLFGLYNETVYVDRSGILWAPTLWSNLPAVSKWDSRKWGIQSYKFEDPNPVRGRNEVLSICEDKTGILWFGTLGDGLVRFDRKENRSIRYLYDPNNSSALSQNFVSCLLEDPVEPGVLWVGTWNGLNKFDSRKGAFTRYTSDPNEPSTISDNVIQSLCVDHEGFLWVGGIHGLNRFDRATGRFTRFQYDPNNPGSISSDWIGPIYEDRSGTLWVGTHAALNRFDRKTGGFISYVSLARGFDYSDVTSIYEDRQGNFWVGTSGSGLHLFDRNKGTSTINFTKKDGLASDHAHFIRGDDSGNLWMSTINGLSKFNTRTHTFRNYGVSDGMVARTESAFLVSNDEIIIGDVNGFNVFRLKDVSDDPVSPQVVINRLTLINQPDDKSTVDRDISETREIELSYNQNDLRFDFVGLHFSAPKTNLYKYILENYDRDWIDAGTQHNVTYTNLDPGEYTFRVKACNRDGVWNEEGASLQIVITPPFWKTWWAYLFYVALFGAVYYGVRRYELNRVGYKHNLELRNVEAEKLQEVDRLKSRFFTNISHEFRTPLTLIQGPIKQLLSGDLKGDKKEQYGVILRNSERLLKLVNQLLSLSKIEAGEMKLRAREENIVEVLRGTFAAFESLARRKQVTLTLDVPTEPVFVYIDKEKVENVFTNLLSNALKFTPEGGAVRVKVAVDPTLTLPLVRGGSEQFSPLVRGRERGGQNTCVEFTVTDTGCGIAPDQLEKIFDRFYQVDDTHTRQQEGTGIGLALARELVVLHRGTIHVQSTPGQGSTFTVRLPLGREHLAPNEIVEEPLDKEARKTAAVSRIEQEELAEMADPDTQSSTHDAPMVLIVEDNPDMRRYIRGHLDESYTIHEAEDGKKGVAQAVETVPDLIISDVMMPEMDGYELVRILKQDERTSHIPIILLTAKAGGESKIEGLETGADDYLIKPFDAKELLTRVKNLIEQRRKLRERFRGEMTLKPRDITITSVDEKFLTRVMALVEEHMADSDFDTEALAREVAMSRMQLHRKLKALTGQSPHEFTRTLRLGRAAQLLEKNAGNISEVAYDVGFNNLSHFAKAFREQFNKSPSEYAESFSKRKE